MSNETQVIPYEQRIGALSIGDVKAQVQLIQHVMREVMQKDQHYGVVPGTGTKFTLLKAGAEKLCLTFRLDPQYEIEQKQEGAHLTIISKCTLWHIPSGQRFGSGMGMCSTRESKYAYRSSSRKCPNCHAESIIKGREEYGGGWICFAKKGGCGAKFLEKDADITSQSVGRVPNEDVADQYNTVLKMGNKRSLVAAVLNATAASDIFTQDIADNEDQTVTADVVSETKSVRKPRAKADANLEALQAASREAELADLCKQANVLPEFYLNRAKVKNASEFSDEDWAEVVATVKLKIKVKAMTDKAADPV